MKLMSLKNKENSKSKLLFLRRSVSIQGRILNFVFTGCLVLLLFFILGLSYPNQVNATRGTKKELDAVLKNKKNPNSGKENSNNQNQDNNNNQNQNQDNNQGNNQYQGNNHKGGLDKIRSRDSGGGNNQNQGNNNNQNQNQNQGGNNQNQNQNGGNGNSNGGSNGGGGGSGGGSTCGSAHTFFDWGCNGASDKDSILTVLVTISNWLAAGVVIAVIGGIIYGAIMYATSAGDASKAKSATEIIRNAFIALILYFLMWAFLQYIVPGGLFN